MYEKEEKKYYKPVTVNNFWSNNYIRYKINGDKNKITSIEEHLNKTRPYLKGIINNLKKPSTWKIQWIIRNNCFSTEDENDEELVKHSKSDDKEIMISDEADEIIKKVSDSLKTRY